MTTMLFALFGIALGLTAGILLPVAVPAAWSAYAAVVLFAALSSLIGAARAGLDRDFRPVEFLMGLAGNALLGVGLTWLGGWIGVPAYPAAVLYFGFRIFYNFSDIRRKLIVNFASQKEHKN